MKFSHRDPDLATLIRRVESGSIDLQPDFQRGEVWTRQKKQRLIDTILRQWHLPPVHLVVRGGGKFDVLDGQQRLTAIRDFFHGKFTVDGTIEPYDAQIALLHGKRFKELPEAVRLELEDFTVRVFELSDYQPGEPHELFFRLNQPTALTEAEKRNAFMGQAREQVRSLVGHAESHGMNAERVGFSNLRMNYDDLLARFCLTLEQGGLEQKITSARVTERYRHATSFSDRTIELATEAIRSLLAFNAFEVFANENRLKTNKATLHTWLCMVAELIALDAGHLAPHLDKTIEVVERERGSGGSDPSLQSVLLVFNDRATARVADVSSIVARDFCAWVLLAARAPQSPHDPERLAAAREWLTTVDVERRTEAAILEYCTSASWGMKWF